MGALDVSDFPSPQEKAEALMTQHVLRLFQSSQRKNPDSAIVFEESIRDLPLLSDFAICMRGIVSGDSDKWIRKFWEQPISQRNRYLQSTPREGGFGRGKEHVIDWSTCGNGMLRPGMTNLAYGRKGVAHAQMGALPATNYDGALYDNNTAAIVPTDAAQLPAIWAYSSAPEFSSAVRKIDQSLKVTNATLVKIPFDLDYWTQIAAELYPNGLPQPYSNDPTQWIFHGHPCGSVIWDDITKWTAHGPLRTDDTVLHIAVARLLGYRWPAELDAEMELAAEQREWVSRCEALLPFADDDGIVCIPPVRGEANAETRLRDLLAAVYGDEWSNQTEAKLLVSAEHAGKSLESWLREKFFTQHCKLFGHRPFIWHIWDGLPDGFAALVNYRQLDHKNLETLIYTYLGDWISRQKQDIANGIDGAQEKLAAAETLKQRLELILKGEAPYDIFVRWKPLAEQAIGWHPDLNDGVRLNIRPFLSVPDIKKKGAGVLKDKPNIKWNKDRGKDVESAPWFDVFNGERINDHHLSLAEKIDSKERAS